MRQPCRWPHASMFVNRTLDTTKLLWCLSYYKVPNPSLLHRYNVFQFNLKTFRWMSNYLFKHFDISHIVRCLSWLWHLCVFLNVFYMPCILYNNVYKHFLCPRYYLLKCIKCRINFTLSHFGLNSEKN